MDEKKTSKTNNSNKTKTISSKAASTKTVKNSSKTTKSVTKKPAAKIAKKPAAKIAKKSATKTAKKPAAKKPANNATNPVAVNKIPAQAPVNDQVKTKKGLFVRIKKFFSPKKTTTDGEAFNKNDLRSKNPAVRAKAEKYVARKERARVATTKKVSPKWLVPVFVGFLLLGLVWVVLYYLSKTFPIPGIGDFNIFIGFSLIVIGVVLATFWK